MRLFFVAATFSPIAARWVEQVVDLGWDIHVYGTGRQDIHPKFRNVTVYGQLPRRHVPKDVKYYSAWPFRRGYDRLLRYFPKLAHTLHLDPPYHIARLIATLQPDLVHSLKMQKEAYHTLDAVKLLGDRLPCPWIHSVWGSDIYLHMRFEEHVDRIRNVLATCNYLMAGNRRDMALALEYGFAGEVLGVFPSGGGYPIQEMQQSVTTKPSERRMIALKGYQAEPGGKVLTALEAIQRCGRIFAGHQIVIHSAIDTYASSCFPQVQMKAREVSDVCGVPIGFLPYSPPERIWELFSQSRIAIAISSTDGTPNAMLEAMIMGAFPIQSSTEGLEDWIQHGVNGFLVPYQDVDEIARAIARALEQDQLVDTAAKLNTDLTRQRLDRAQIREQVIERYRYVLNNQLARSK